MLTFFKKKIFLIDHLHGLIDMHNHILPGIDDGANTVEESIELIKAFSEFGVNNFICTPHIMNHYYPNTPKTIKRAFDTLQKGLTIQGIDDVKLDYAAEHMIDDNFENLLENSSVLPLRKDYLLVEMSYLQPSLNFYDAIQKTASHQYFVILAHPERYAYYHKEFSIYTDHKLRGVKFQANLLSIGGYYGSEIQKIAFRLLKEKMIDFLSSDVHNMRHLNAIKEIKVSKKVLEKIIPVVNNTLATFY